MDLSGIYNWQFAGQESAGCPEVACLLYQRESGTAAWRAFRTLLLKISWSLSLDKWDKVQLIVLPFMSEGFLGLYDADGWLRLLECWEFGTIRCRVFAHSHRFTDGYGPNAASTNILYHSRECSDCEMVDKFGWAWWLSLWQTTHARRFYQMLSANVQHPAIILLNI